MIDVAALRAGKLRRKTKRKRSSVQSARRALKQVGGLRHVVRSSWKAGQTLRTEGMGVQSEALKELTPAEHHALPLALLVERHQQDRWEAKGSWVLDTGLSHNKDLSCSHYHTADDVLQAAMQLPQRHKTGDVAIYFRQTGAASCVHPFDTSNNEPVPARLERLEADYMELENHAKRNTGRVAGKKGMDARMKKHGEGEDDGEPSPDAQYALRGVASAVTGAVT